MDDALQFASRNRAQLILGVCALGVIAGSLGPWAEIVMETIHGVSGDGQLTLFLGVFAAAFILLEFLRHKGSRGRYLCVTFAFFLAGLIGLNAWLSVGSTIAQSELNARVGWGLQLMTVAAFVGGAVAYLQVKAINRETRRQRRLRRDEEEAAAEIERAKQL